MRTPFTTLLAMHHEFDCDVLAGARNCSDAMLHTLHARMGSQDIDMRPPSKYPSVPGRCMRIYIARCYAEKLYVSRHGAKLCVMSSSKRASLPSHGIQLPRLWSPPSDSSGVPTHKVTLLKVSVPLNQEVRSSFSREKHSMSFNSITLVNLGAAHRGLGDICTAK